MIKLKTYVSLLLALIGSFKLGMLFIFTKYNIKEVENYTWILTIVFGLYFLIIAVDRLLKNK